MNEQRLRTLLREAPVPGAEEAERRGLRVVNGAFAQRQPPPRRPALPRLALALAAATLLTALLLSPAGAAVRDWIDDVLTVGVRDAEPALTEVPGGGRLLVASPQGSWVVQPDGSRRLLGGYAEATWSPRGLFVAAVSGRVLSAVEPGGTVHWSLSSTAPISDPRWSPSGFRIAYRTGRALRVVGGDGTGDRLLDRRVAPVAVAWWPQGPHLLAYVDAGGELRIVNADSGETVGSAAAAGGTRQLAWAPDGSQLLEATRRSLLLRELRIGKLAGTVEIGSTRRLRLPAGAAIRSASFSPRGETIAVLLELPARGTRPPRGELALVDPANESKRPLFTAPGRLSDLAWSPDGKRLLITWADADQWLFIPASGRGRVRAIGGISGEFDPGGKPWPVGFPRIEGWCCAATIGDPASP
jgi:dipeptidyl aminopeptidase/acylaminoacyl peptidase